MKIEEINIDGFGKFHKYHCQTSGKLEVFYGKNESGKTTLRKFMIAMLFGLEKSRGLAARYDDFTRYQPVNGGIYGGSMVFEKDGIRYKIMRNFGQGQTEYRIFDADTMEELKGKEYLFESDQQAFENTGFDDTGRDSYRQRDEGSFAKFHGESAKQQGCRDRPSKSDRSFESQTKTNAKRSCVCTE